VSGLRRLEGIPVLVGSDAAAIAREVATRIADLVRRRSLGGRRTVLGLATGATPLGVYRELVRLHRDEGLELEKVETFNLDEYYPMDPANENSYHSYMREKLFDHVDVPADRIHIPHGDVPRAEVEAHCVEYEDAIRNAGGIDLQILGIGRDGHIGFNEPGSARDSRTRLVDLDAVTRADAAHEFGGLENVPRQAITMGVATIMGAREIVLMALGAHKAEVVERAVADPVGSEVAATFLREHAAAVVYVDPPAATELLGGIRARRERASGGS
jgi:glucosamine-6-phosphate deaminase